MKKLTKIALVLTFGLLLSACGKKSAPTEPQNNTQQRIINQLPIDQRPFVALFPHPSGKLVTLYIDKPGDIKDAKLEIEYLSGNSLKGGRASLDFPTSLPYTRSFLLGTCSAGGSCSFDTDLSTGTVKTSFKLGKDLHVLKDTFVFINGPSQTSDLRAKFEPSKALIGRQILSFTHGYPNQTNLQVTQPGLILTSGNSNKIQGELSLKAPQASQLYYFDGQKYQELPTQKQDQYLTTRLNHAPQSKQIEIIRDDLQGKTETVTLYSIGPIIATQ